MRNPELSTSDIDNEADQAIQDFNVSLAKELDSEEPQELPEEFPGSAQDYQVASAAFRALPDDPTARLVLVDEFRKRPDGRFGDAALHALETYERYGQALRQAIGWRRWVSYPKALKPATAELLDRLSENIPLPVVGDKYTAMTEFLARAQREGFITDEQMRTLRNDVANEL